MLSLENIWQSVSNLFPVLDDATAHPKESAEEMHMVQKQLHQMGVFEVMEDLIWLEICRCSRHDVKTNLFQISDRTKPNDTVIFENFISLVEGLNENFGRLAKYSNLSTQLVKTTEYKNNLYEIQNYFRETLIYNMAPHWSNCFDTFHNISFMVFGNVYKKDQTNLEAKENICTGCKKDSTVCCCNALLYRILNTNLLLQNMNLLDSIAGYHMTTAVQRIIKEYIHRTCTGIFDRSHLNRLESWLENVIMKWLIGIFKEKEYNSIVLENNSINVLQSFKIRLTYFLYETFARNVIDQFFSIIIDFPDSVPALDDLKICLEKIDIRQYMIVNIKNTLKNRILHPGVNTMDILTGYVAAIKAIRHLDTSGIILDNVIEPIKEYLRKRSDTVRRVVTGLTEEGPTDLSEELAKGEFVNASTPALVFDDMSVWENWMPEPSTFDFTYKHIYNGLDRTAADIISMVIDIYGSKELFMNEYRNLMGDRLLSQLEFIPEKEIRNLELLKLRFGENLLHNCEVMLKDVSDSKRINSHIHADSAYKNAKSFEISALILSAQFWPSFNKESLELPEEIGKEFKKFTKAFEAYKGNRTLQWRTVTGRVNIIIELEHRTIEMTVLPIQAVILYHFQKKKKWTLDELCFAMKVTPSTLKRRIHFWKVHGLIKEVETNSYELVEDKNSKNSSLLNIQNINAIDDESESVMASANDQREEELQVFWSYIVGMLTNLDCLPIERIHQMLKLFASQGIGIDFSQEELKNFLQRKVREHKLIFSAGVYQLSK